MAAKQIKVNLKNAKQAIQAKNYKLASEHCQEAIHLDENNYNALVFMGLCNAELRHYDLAARSYEKAIKANPDQILAYQGVVSLFTKHKCENLTGSDRQLLIEAYLKLIALNSSGGSSKTQELLVGLTKAYCTSEQYELAFQTLQDVLYIGKSQDISDDDTALEAALFALENSSKGYGDLGSFSKMICDFSSKFCRHANAKLVRKECCLTHWLQYLHFHDNLLSQSLTEVHEACLSIFRAHPSSNLCCEVMLQIYLQTDMDADPELLASIFASYSGPYKSFYDGFGFHSKGQLQQCVSALDEGLVRASDFIPAWLLLCKSHLKLNQALSAEKAAKNALQECKQSSSTQTWLLQIKPIAELKLELTECLADAMALQHNIPTLKLAISTYEKLLKLNPNSSHSLFGLLNVHLKLDDWEAIKSCLKTVQRQIPDNPTVQCWSAYLRFQEGGREEAISELEELTRRNPQAFLPVFFLAKHMWKYGGAYKTDRTKCLSRFLAAAKLDPFSGEAFLYLGHFYKEVAQDLARARKCYQKAYALEPGNEAAGSSLADVHVAQGNYEEAIALYEGVTSVAPPGTCKWAWLRLGLCKLKIKDANSAIKCFQAALRADSDDHICWECLGEGYINRGSYTAAWKAFNKAHQLSPTSVYSLYQMAAIKQILGQHAEAVAEYGEVFLLEKDYVPALKGLAESHLAIANQMRSEGRDLTCVDHLQEAISCLTKAISSSGHMSCLWKLLGDCLTTIHPLDRGQVRLPVPAVLCPQEGNASDGVTELGKLKALRLGSKCYSRAIALREQCATYWHDLGVNLFRQAGEEQELDLSKGLAAKSILTIQRAVALAPGDYLMWNSLGVVASSKYVENRPLAQHSLIRSIECEPNNCWSWTNLGCLYLTHSHVELAHRAFKVAQSLEPSYAQSWIGQALVAESIGSVETMDLFRHSTELALHGQAAVGYAYWVLRTLTDCRDRSKRQYREEIHDMNAVSTALTHLSKYCARNPRCAWSHTMLGLLLEETGLNRSALDAYRQALANCEHEYEANEANANLDKAKSNFARALSASGDHHQAAEVFGRISVPLDFHQTCALALAHRKLGDYERATELYESSLRLTSSDRDRAGVAVAAATLAWKRGKTEKAKTLLEAWMTKSLLARQVVAAMDLRQASTANCDVTDLISPSDAGRDAVMRSCLVAAAVALRNSPERACRVVQKFVRKYPSDWRFRTLLAQLILDARVSLPASLAQRLASGAMDAYLSDDVSATVRRDLVRHSGTECRLEHQLVATLLALTTLGSGKHDFGKDGRDDALKASQRLMHCHPYDSDAWAILSSACHANSVYSKIVGKPNTLNADCQNYSSLVAQQSPSKNIREWALKQRVLSLVASKDFDLAAEVAVEDGGSEMDAISMLVDCCREISAEGKLEKSTIGEVRRMTAKSDEDRMLAAHILRTLSLHEEATAALREFLPAVKSCDQRRTAALKIFRLVWRKNGLSSSGGGGGGVDKESIDLAGEALAILKREGETPHLQLFEGLYRYLEKNHRKCRIALTKATYATCGDTWCLCGSMAACYLYATLHAKNDRIELEKLVQRLDDDPVLKLLRERFPFA